MVYLIVVACGEKVSNRRVAGVKDVEIIDGIYKLYDYSNTINFSAPADSVVYMELDQS